MVTQGVPLSLHIGSDTSCSVTYLGLLAKASSWESSGTTVGAETLCNDFTIRSTTER